MTRVLSVLLLSALVAGAWCAPCAKADESATTTEVVKRWIRDRLVESADPDDYGLKFDDAPKTDTTEDLVVLVHGLNSRTEKSPGLLAMLRQAGFPTATFNYPNDQPIVDSAKLLSADLKQLAEKDATRRVSLVTHSMGGLVARASIEDAALDPGNVRRLVMIAPPSHGSVLAGWSKGVDMWEHTFGRRSGGPWDRVRDSIVDGLAEAADDLKPGSPFLTELNARERNPRVRYTIILGTGGAAQQWELDLARKGLQKTAGKISFAREKVDELDAILADLDEVLAGKGDGVVAVKRGRLEGVEDTIVLPFGHLSVTDEGDYKSSAEVRAAVLARLQDKPGQTDMKPAVP